MGDPLSVLRDFITHQKYFLETETHVFFGDLSWPKNTNTNYLKWGSGKNKRPKEYYTLECILYLLKYVTLLHPFYVRQAIIDKKEFVHRPDRKTLLAYLHGEIDKPASVDIQDPRPILTGI